MHSSSHFGFRRPSWFFSVSEAQSYCFININHIAKLNNFNKIRSITPYNDGPHNATRFGTILPYSDRHVKMTFVLHNLLLLISDNHKKLFLCFQTHTLNCSLNYIAIHWKILIKQNAFKSYFNGDPFMTLTSH